MLPLRTKDSKNYKLLTILLKPSTLSGHDVVFVCIDKDYKPIEISIKDVEQVGK